ncbi:uncharacterized protein LOC110855830 [Folsomia candida]|nr:uncharacterized protein LOC110855830 [Folsomia candida]
MKSYWNKNCDIGLLRAYEDQPWFKNRVVQAEWRNFVDQLVTPSNIGCQACPGPDDWSFKCHKVRSLIGPTIPCVWELPEKDKCDPTQYGINRDWRRYNEDQRIAASDISCGCNKAPICYPKTRCEWPPYLGVKYGPRYMAWAHPSKGNFPRTSTVFNYQSLPQC